MARRVAEAGFDLTIWNRTPGKTADLAETTGARVAKTPADAARGAEVVITCLSTSHDVEYLLGQPDGLLQGLERGTTLVDCTSGDPATSRRIAERLHERGVSFIDAPVSGGTSGATVTSYFCSTSRNCFSSYRGKVTSVAPCRRPRFITTCRP